MWDADSEPRGKHAGRLVKRHCLMEAGCLIFVCFSK